MQRSILIVVLVFVGLNAIAQNVLEFVENKGQWQEDFAYRSQTPKGDIFLQKGGYVIKLASHQNHDLVHDYKHHRIKTPPVLKYHAYKVDFLGASERQTFVGHKQQKHYYNYFLGNDSSKWKSFIQPYLAVDYKDLYDGVDAHIYTDAGNIKYDLIVKPGSDVKRIKLRYTGVDKLTLNKGNLVIGTSLGDMTELKPYAYQNINGERKKVLCNYQLEGNIVAFSFPEGYDESTTLIIDPVLVFCSFSGSTADNWGFSATYDTAGNFYGAGITNSSFGSYPVTLGAYQTTWGGGTGIMPADITISKFNPTGTTLIYATYIGGSNNDQPHSIICDQTGNLVIAGRTLSTNYPTTAGCYDPTANGGSDIFVTKLNATGSALIGSTYIGGSGNDCLNISDNSSPLSSLKHNYGDDARSEVILDANNNIYVAAETFSTNFPTTSNALSSTLGGAQDGVVIQLNPNCSALLWSTYIGGTNDDACYVLSFDKTAPNVLYVAGGTASSNFPTTPGTLNSTYQGNIDGFLMRFNASTKALVASTFIGTSAYDQVYGVQTDDSNSVYVMGQTQGNYPVTPGVYSNPGSAQFITKLNNNLNNIQLSTVFGKGSTAQTDISPTAFLVDRCGNIYVSGWGGNVIPTQPGNTTGLPLSVAPATPLQSTTDGSDFYYFVLSKNMNSLLYATFFGLNNTLTGHEHVDGGTSRFDPNGVIYQAICAACGNTLGFPTTTGAYATVNGSTNCNLGAVKIDFQLQDPDADASGTGNTSGCAPHTVNFINNSVSATNFIWDFGDGSPTTTATNPTHTYTVAGTYTARLIANNPNGCTLASDTDFIQIIVIDDSVNANFTVTKVDSCDPFSANFTNTTTFNNGPPNSNTTYFWDFGDGTTFNGFNPPLHVYSAPQSYTVRLIVTDTNACNNPDTAIVTIDFSTSTVSAGFNCPDSVCLPANVTFTNLSTNASTYAWTFGDGGTSTSAGPTHTFTAPGVYTITLITANPNSCNLLDTFSKTISVFGNPTADFSYTPNPPLPNKALQFQNLSVGATSYKWDFGDGNTSVDVNPKHIYNRDGLYQVCLTATNDVGCIDTACKNVRGYVIPLVDVPSGFSPNGDGINDLLHVLGYGIETMRFQIYNRWGQLVFETTDRFKGWDGTFKGEPQEMDVFGYLLDVTFFDGSKRTKKGNITLLR